METKSDRFFLKNKKQKPDKREKNDFKNKKNNRQDNYDKNRNGLEDSKKEDKKPFDKKTYRIKKYSKKYKLEQWEEQRKRKMLHEYKKSMKNDAVSGSYKAKSFDEDITDSISVGRFVKHPDLLEKELKENKKKDPFSKAKEQFNKVKQDKIERQQAIEKSKEEKKQKLEEYKKKKQERFKKLSKKTKKGQPVMMGRMELLLEKIQGSK